MLAVAGAGCGERAPRTDAAGRATPHAAIGGFDGPEAVKWDDAQGAWFVSNFGGDSDSLDNNGFISRLRADGSVDSLHFILGGRGGVTLHMPRGMALRGDTLWVADADAVRAFDRRTGAPLAAVDFTAHQPGFLNDLAFGPDGALYVTDTGARRIYRIANGAIETPLADSALGGPNGIVWDAAGNRFLVAPFFEGQALLSWRPGGMLAPVSEGRGGRYDGVEVIAPDSFVVASQADSSLHLFGAAEGRPWLLLRGRPADIGWNPGGRIVAVPYVSRDTVELFRLP